jgi:hypothetical protein
VRHRPTSITPLQTSTLTPSGRTGREPVNKAIGFRIHNEVGSSSGSMAILTPFGENMERKVLSQARANAWGRTSRKKKEHMRKLLASTNKSVSTGPTGANKWGKQNRN